MRRNTPRIMTGGAPANWLGANFWSRTGGPLMWRHYDPAVIDAELAVLERHGLTMTRSFFYWPDFMPGPQQIDETMTARFADFLDRHAARGLTTIPTFIVGHMSGENWDPAWRGGRDLYNDVWMVGRQAWFAAEMVRRFHEHPAVAGWLVSNEMPIYGGTGTDHEVVATWARIIRDAVRAAGGQPAAVARRRRLGHRGDRHRQRVPAGRRGRAGRLPRPAHLPGRRRPGPAALRRRHRLRAGGHLRQAGDHGGVRGQLRLRLARERRRLLPAPAAQHAAGRGQRVDRVEQHRLRPAAAGPVPAPRVRAELRPHRHPRHPQGHPAGNAAVRGHAGRHRLRRLRAGRHRHRADRVQLPGHRVPVHRARGPRRGRPDAAPGLHLGPAGRPAAPADPGDDRDRARRPALPGPVGQAGPRHYRRRPPAAGRGRRHASTSLTGPATPPGSGARPSAR